MSNLMKKRLKTLGLWQKNLLDKRSAAESPNPRHDFAFYRTLRISAPGETIRVVGSELKEELAAWDEASDSDFESFEASLKLGQ